MGSGDPRNSFELDGLSFAIDYQGNTAPLEHRFHDRVCTYFASDKQHSARSAPYKAYRGAHLLLWLEKSHSPLSRAFILFDKHFQTAICFGVTASNSGKMSVSIRRGAVNGPYTYETALQFPPHSNVDQTSKPSRFPESWCYELGGASLFVGISKSRMEARIIYDQSMTRTLVYTIEQSGFIEEARLIERMN